MGAFNAELVTAGVLLSGEGLHPSAEGRRVIATGKSHHVVDGPFAETKELVAGFWIWQVKSMDEAVDWAKRIPNVDGVEHAVELRPVFEMDDFGEAMTPERREVEEKLRAEVEAKQ